MHLTVRPSNLTGAVIRVPGDKSISHRALMLASIADGTSRIRNFLNGADCLATAAALRAMGVSIRIGDPDAVIVDGVGPSGLQPPAAPLDLGNSGTAMRLFAGLLAGQPFDTELVGDESLTQRPMRRVIDPLTRMGASIDSRDGMPPLRIRGHRPLSGIAYDLPVASAQVKSAILLASLYAAGECCITEPATTRDHTERMLESMGIVFEQREGSLRLAGGQAPQAVDIDVPGDLSSAAFLILAALLAPDCDVTIVGVGVNPTRTGVLEILRGMGADIRVENPRNFGREPVADLRVVSSGLHGIEVDPELVSLAIDEFPLLFVAAAAATGETHFSGIAELRVKESDRIAAMSRGLRTLGIEVEEWPDGARIRGGNISGGTVDCFHDHRIAMSLAIAATCAEGPVTIRDTDNIATSFPGFTASLRQLGADVTEDGVAAS